MNGNYTSYKKPKIINVSDQIHCPLCNSNNLSFLCEGYDRFYGIEGEFSIYKCGNCKITFTLPQISGDLIAKHYPKDYYAYQIHISKTRKEKINLFFKKPFIFFDLFFCKIVDFLLFPFKRKQIGFLGDKILDVGCGSGEFLKSLKSRGCELYGIDIGNVDKESMRLSGIIYTQSDLRTFLIDQPIFDYITLNHVFEHFDDPLFHASKLYQLLKPGGKIIITVPNISSLNRFIFGKYWMAYEIPRHLFHYNTKTLSNIFTEVGFIKGKIKFNTVPAIFLASFYYSINSLLKRETPLSLSNFWTNGYLNLLLVPYVYILNFFRIGDQFEIIFSKPVS